MLTSILILYYTYISSFFFFNDTATTEIYTLSLHDALPICSTTARASRSTTSPSRRCRSKRCWSIFCASATRSPGRSTSRARSEEHTSELQSPCNLVCRLLLEKKKKNKKKVHTIYTVSC